VRYILKYKLDHIAFWLVTVLFYALIRKDLIASAGPFYFLADVIVRNLLIAAICYLNIYCLFDRLFKKGRYLLYGASLMALLLTYTALQNGYDTLVIKYLNKHTVTRSFFYNAYYHFSVGVFYLTFTLALELSKRWYRQQSLLRQIQTEKLQTELQFLKAQLNPHFLFNSINTIYFQIDKSNAAARESLEKFSELLRYQLYECNEDRIPIEKEISYLESYVDLQRLRKNRRDIIRFNTDENVRGFCIAPLLLLPFVENAFKHLSNYSGSGNIVELKMNRQNGSFLFSLSNSVDPDTENKQEPGIGLKNVRRRLDLLYENEYTLDIQRHPLTFSVELQIKIT
jgi:two-component system, LytTR family, sensor kinase